MACYECDYTNEDCPDCGECICECMCEDYYDDYGHGSDDI